MNSGPNDTWFATTPAFWSALKMPCIAWQLWYASGEVVTSEESTWSAAPRDGVQVLMAHHPGGFRTVVKGRDEYTWPGCCASKFGKMIPLEQFHAILQAAMDDPWRPS